MSEARSAVLRHIGEELRASRAFFTEPDLDRCEAIVGEEYLAPGVASLAGVHRFSGRVAAVYAEGRPVVLADFREHPAFAEDSKRQAIAELPFLAVLDIPLVRDGRVVAVLSIHQTERREWSGQETALAFATAERSWSLIERARAEEKARLAADEMEAIYATAPVGLTVLDTDLRFVRINQRMAETNGFTPAEHIGKSVRELVPRLPIRPRRRSARS